GAAPGTAGTNGDDSGANFSFWTGSAYSSTTAATNLANAIVRTGNANVPVTATASSSTVTVIADDPGTAQNAFALSNGLTGMSGFNSTLSGGTTATQDSTHFAISAITSTEASNLATTINANGSTGVTAVGNSPSSGQVKVTANTAGTSG